METGDILVIKKIKIKETGSFITILSTPLVF